MMDLLRHLPWWAYIAVFVPMFMLYRAGRQDATRGRVVGIVGRMGSGKSYMAVRMAFRRMRHGANVMTNFTMHLECPPEGHRRQRWGRLVLPARWCPCEIAPRWQRFVGWDQLLSAEGVVVIIDEADLYAAAGDPSFNIPEKVRYKLKMARKYRIDLYWLTQHPAMVSPLLRTRLTNEIYRCRSWFGGRWFSAMSWDPMEYGRAKKHLSRVNYRLNKRIACLYDTLEMIEGDTTISKDGTMVEAVALARLHNGGNTRCVHERRAKGRAGSCKLAECIEAREVKVKRESGPDGQRVRQRRGPKARLQAGGPAAQAS